MYRYMIPNYIFKFCYIKIQKYTNDIFHNLFIFFSCLRLKLNGRKLQWNLNRSGIFHTVSVQWTGNIKIKKSSNSGSYYFNYKKTFSIVLMAIVNVNYEFLMIDVGANGRASDLGVYESTKFYRYLEEGELNIPSQE